MKSTHVFKTTNNNCYLFDKKQKIFCPINPKQYAVIKQNESYKEFIEIIAPDELEYYQKKYLWLKECGYFGEIDSKKRFSGRISAENIRYNLANLKQLTFEVTDKCNLNCTYCAYGLLYGDFDTRNNKSLDFEDAKRVIDYLVPYINSDLNNSREGFMYISFYGGEPLMGFDFIVNVISYVTKLIVNKKFNFSMTTNAMLLNKYIDYLVDKDVNLLISLDGDEGCNSYRIDHNKKSSFKKVIENIDLVFEKFPQYFEKHVSFNSVLHNKNDEASILSFFKNRYNKTPTISPLNNSGIKEDSIEDFNNIFRNINEYKLTANEDYQNIRKDLFLNLPSVSAVSTFLSRNTNSLFPTIKDVFIDDYEKQFVPTGSCIPFSKKMFVTVNKKIMFCERIGHEYYAGTINGYDLILDENKIALDFNRYIKGFYKQCQNCYINENCSQCMYYVENLGNNPKCKVFMNINDYNKYLSSIFTYMEDNPNDIERIKNEVIID